MPTPAATASKLLPPCGKYVEAYMSMLTKSCGWRNDGERGVARDDVSVRVGESEQALASTVRFAMADGSAGTMIAVAVDVRESLPAEVGETAVQAALDVAAQSWLGAILQPLGEAAMLISQGRADRGMNDD